MSSDGLIKVSDHGIVSKDTVLKAMKKMAKVVDRQNASDSAYSAMSEDYSGSAFKAACDLVILGKEQPSGYTEPVLHTRRQELKLSLQG
jgi:malate synthase